MGSILFNSSSSGSFGSSLGIGISGLNAARLALQIAGHNIANVNTPGYSRQQAILTTREPSITSIGGIGTGVKVISIQAIRDRFLELQIATESQQLGSLRVSSNVLANLESMFNPIGVPSISSATDSLFSGFQDLASNPESMAQREQLLGQGRSLASFSNKLTTQLNTMKLNLNEQIRSQLSEVNRILEEVANLNARLSSGGSLSLSLEDLRDQRNQLFKRLNELMGVQGFEDENGVLTVTTFNGNPLVVQNQSAQLSTTGNAVDPNTLDIISTFNNSQINITRVLQGGSLDAMVQQRDQVTSQLISAQRRFAAILADAVNAEHRRGSDLAGNAGGDFFSDPFAITDSSTLANVLNVAIVGDNASFEINYSVVNNAPSGATVTGVDISDATTLSKHDFLIAFAGGTFTVTDTSTGQDVTANAVLAGTTLTIDGTDFVFSAAPADGDSFDLTFDGRTGVTGDVYRIEFIDAAGSYQVIDVSSLDSTPVATGTFVLADRFIFFDGLAVEIDALPESGARFTIDYAGLEVDPNLTALGIAASSSAPGAPEPGNNQNAFQLAGINTKVLVGLGNRSFSIFQATEISSVGTQKSDADALLSSQEKFINALEQQRVAVSGVSLDEEATSLIEFQQAFQASARFIGQINDLLDFLMNQLG